MPPHGDVVLDTLVFYKLKSTPDLRFTTLKILLQGFSRKTNLRPDEKRVARDLVTLVHDHCQLLQHHCDSVENVKQFMGCNIPLVEMFMPKISDAEWLKSVEFDKPRMQARDLACRILHSSNDRQKLAWFNSGIVTNPLSPKKISTLEVAINKASAALIPKKKNHFFAC
jgi:hypothetical protein